MGVFQLKKLKYVISYLLAFVLFFNFMLMPTYASNVKCNNDFLNMMSKELDNYVNPLIGQVAPGASIAVVKDGETLLKGYGYADIENNLPIDPSSSTFNYASVSKLFIWVSAMQLVEQGKLDLNRNISAYLPNGYPIKFNYNTDVTMLNLMNHNAGFDAACSTLGEKGDAGSDSIGTALYRFYDVEQCFTPNTYVGYSNYGSNLAAFIIEQITGQDFYSYVEEHIFNPCGMKCCYPERHPNLECMAHKVKGYSHSTNGSFSLSSCYHSDWLYPSGSAVGTVNVFAFFAKALMPADGETSPLFNSNDTLYEMFETSYSPTNSELFSIHHGFWGTNGNYTGIGHTGCVQGFVSHFVINPNENLAAIALVNDDYGYDISYGVINLITSFYSIQTLPYYELPDSYEVEGAFLHARDRFHNRTTPFTPYFVKTIDKNTIEVKHGNSMQIYKQVKPYLYENISAKSGAEFKNKIYFTVSRGKVIKISSFHNDFIPILR